MDKLHINFTTSTSTKIWSPNVSKQSSFTFNNILNPRPVSPLSVYYIRDGLAYFYTLPYRCTDSICPQSLVYITICHHSVYIAKIFMWVHLM